MNLRDRDVVLPWQFTLLGFLAFGVFMALLVLVTTLICGARDRTRLLIYQITIPYLILVGALTPLLIASGRKKVRRWKEQNGQQVLAYGDQIAGLGETFEVSPTRGIALGILSILVGIMYAVLASMVVFPGLLPWFIAVILIVGGISAIGYHHSRRDIYRLSEGRPMEAAPTRGAPSASIGAATPPPPPRPVLPPRPPRPGQR